MQTRSGRRKDDVTLAWHEFRLEDFCQHFPSMCRKEHTQEDERCLLELAGHHLLLLLGFCTKLMEYEPVAASWFSWKLLVERPNGRRTMFPRSLSLPARGQRSSDKKYTDRSLQTNPVSSVNDLEITALKTISALRSGVVRTHHFLLQLLVPLMDLLR